MNDRFIKKIIEHGSHDTKNFHYVATYTPHGIYIRRAPLGTTDWEIVKIIKRRIDR